MNAKPPTNGVLEMELRPAPEPSEALATAPAVSMFERLAVDPSVSVEKLERLMALHERVLARDAESAYNVAMSAAQSEMRPVATDASNPQTRSRYASYEALDRALRPIYTKHGFALSFNTGDAPLPEYVRVLCDVTHIGGHARPYRADMPADGKGAKGGDVMTKTHAVGSAMSYGMRYLLKMIFNVAVGEDDDDGNAAGREQPAATAPDGFDRWLTALEAVASDKASFIDAWNKSDKALRTHLTRTNPDKLRAIRKTAGIS